MRVHVAQTPVPDCAEALEDRAVEDVCPDRVRRLEAEDDYEDGRQHAPPPIPVKLTRTPISSPVSVNCQVKRYAWYA